MSSEVRPRPCALETDNGIDASAGALAVTSGSAPGDVSDTNKSVSLMALMLAGTRCSVRVSVPERDHMTHEMRACNGVEEEDDEEEDGEDDEEEDGEDDEEVS